MSNLWTSGGLSWLSGCFKWCLQPSSKHFLTPTDANGARAAAERAAGGERAVGCRVAVQSHRCSTGVPQVFHRCSTSVPQVFHRCPGSPFLAALALVRDDFCSPGTAIPRLGLYNTIEEEGWGTTIYAPSFEHCTGPPLPNGVGTCALYRCRVRPLRGVPPPPPPTKYSTPNRQVYFEPGCRPRSNLPA
jgi:hypothetical protein